MNKIKVYDINAFIGQYYPEYEAFRYKKAAIFEGPRGVVFAEEEAVHQRENKITDSVVVPLCHKREEKDGHITMAIMASAEMTVSLDEIVAKAPYEEKTMEEFFARRDYNSRCQDNYATLMNSLRDIGFELKGYFEEKTPHTEQLIEKLEDIDFVMKNYLNDIFYGAKLSESNDGRYVVEYEDKKLTIEFDPSWSEYVYTVNGKGPFAHSSYEYIGQDCRVVLAMEEREQKPPLDNQMSDAAAKVAEPKHNDKDKSEIER